jgi:hypothetical protein
MAVAVIPRVSWYFAGYNDIHKPMGQKESSTCVKVELQPGLMNIEQATSNHVSSSTGLRHHQSFNASPRGFRS